LETYPTVCERCVAALKEIEADAKQYGDDRRTLIETAGFSIAGAENSYLPRAPRMVGYLYEGRAHP